jgi:Icc-related predicted phosphoesterase
MKIVCISDTHSKVIPDDQIPECDVIIHAGDITNNGKIFWLQQQAEWFRHLVDTKCLHLCCIGGNHDFILDGFRKENSEYALDSVFASNRVHYLRDSSVTLRFMGREKPVKFYGTPWTISGEWAFSEMDRYKRREIFDKIPMDTDILVSHGPPYGVLDRCDNGSHGYGSVGDLELLGAVERVRPLVHCFGHIHDGAGLTKIGGTTFVNAAVTRVKPTDADPYPLGNPPIIVEI